MIIIRCTGRVRRRFRLEVAHEPQESSTILGSWYANLLNFERQRHVLCVSERTSLPVLVPARNSEFPNRLPEYVGQILAHLAIPQAAIEEEVREMSPMEVGRTQDRSLLGVMNDFARMAPHYLAHGSVLETSLWLGQAPSGPLGYASAIRRTHEAFGVREPPFDA